MTCSHVQPIFGIPIGGRKLVLDTHYICEGRIPSITEIEDLMVETENVVEFYLLFIIFVRATLFSPTTCLEGHHALWHAPLESLTGDVN